MRSTARALLAWAALAVAGVLAGACSGGGNVADSGPPSDAGADGPSRDATGDAPTADVGADLEDAGADAVEPPPTWATGSVDPWQELPPMPLPRANHCAAIVAGQLVVVGGNYRPAGSDGFVATDTVHAARLTPEGGLEAWREVGRTPSPVIGCTAVGHAGHLILAGGIYDDPAQGGRVLAAALGEDGSLGEWRELGPLPDGSSANSSEAFVHASTLYVFDTRVVEDGMPVGSLRAPLTLEGTELTLGPLALDLWLQDFRGLAQYALASVQGTAFLYRLGGYHVGDTVVQTDVAFGRIGDDLSVGQAMPTTPLPAPIAFGAAVAVDEVLFVLGGRSVTMGGAARAEVLSAPIGPDGQLGDFTEQTPLPEPRTNLEVVLGGDHVYVTGGASGMGGLDTVYSARVRFPR